VARATCERELSDRTYERPAVTRLTRHRRAVARRRRRLALAALTLVVAAGGAAAFWSRDGNAPARKAASASVPLRPAPVVIAAHARVRTQRVVRLREAHDGRLPLAMQDAAAAATPGRGIALLGGLGATDLSLDEALVARAATTRSLGRLPHALHDAPGVRIGARIYVFGGGDGVGQLSGITSVDLATGRTSNAGSLPTASSDSAAAALGDTAYVVGGFTGTTWLDTIVAWRPGGRARVVGRLASPVRYAAVAFAHGLLVIAGGSLPDGTASRSVSTFDPRTRRVRLIARLPAPTTHAAAATIGEVAYVIGGRGPETNTPTARIVSIDPVKRRVRGAGSLLGARSDLAAVSAGNSIVIAGGRSRTGTLATVSLLRPIVAVRRARATRHVAARSVYSHDRAGMLRGAARLARPLVYVPNSQSNTVDVIDPRTYRVIEHFAVGALPQHVTPSWDLTTLYVDNDQGNSLTPIDPVTGRPKGRVIPVADPYNLYFTPDGRSAIVVAERLHRLDFRHPRTFALQRSLSVPCRGVDHMDFTANGRYALASCEFSGELVRVDLRRRRVVGTTRLHAGAMPQDVKLAPDGRIFYVADMMAGGVWEVSARSFRVTGFLRTGAGAHGLYPSRDARYLYVSNRSAGTVSVISFHARRVVRTWRIPHGTPDMGGVSANGKVLWLSGRYSHEVYAIDTRNGHLLARIPVGAGPHGLAVWPQPGRHSLGHTGILR
jgi:YVTN family beta-propeller protein